MSEGKVGNDKSDPADGERMPLWVKVLAIGLVLFAAMVIAHLAMGGHGPGHHVGLRDARQQVVMTGVGLSRNGLG